MLTRRQWIGSGVLAATALGIAGLSADSMETDRDVLAAIVPVMLAGALPLDPEKRRRAVADAIDGFDIAISGLTPSVQAQILQLFSLMRIAPLRIAATGIVGPWSKTAPARIEAFLTGWRYSSLSTLRGAYDALHQLIYAAWYGQPQSWTSVGYPGPPAGVHPNP